MKNEFRRRLLWNIGIIGGSIMVGFAILYFLGMRIEKKSVAIIQSRALITQRSFALDNLASLKKTEPLAEEYQQRINALLPTQDNLLGFPRFLEATARTYDILLSFSFQGDPVPSLGGKPGYVSFVLRTTGPRENIVNFVQYLESKSTQFLVNIESIDFSAASDQYHVDIFGKVFSR